MIEQKLYFKYWGKAAKDGTYHLLPYHCLDVAAVGWILLSPQKSLCTRIAAQLGLEPGWLRDFLSSVSPFTIWASFRGHFRD